MPGVFIILEITPYLIIRDTPPTNPKIIGLYTFYVLRKWTLILH